MAYKLFLDDDCRTPGLESFRYPPADQSDWIMATSSSEAISIIDRLGPPSFISFDHDLGILDDGTVDTSITVINYLADNYYDFDIEYRIHSQNPCGRINIDSKMKSWKRSRSLP